MNKDSGRPESEPLDGAEDMKCEKCSTAVEPGEERNHLGMTLCEDCYMDALSPAKGCDPWAVHSAKSLSQAQGGRVTLNEVQKKILEILSETGGIEPPLLARRLELSPKALEREVATLRHMEKARGEMREGKKVFLVLW